MFTGKLFSFTIFDLNMVGMSKEKLFDMWQNYEFSNIHATYSYFFSKNKTETAKAEQRQLLEKKNNT